MKVKCTFANVKQTPYEYLIEYYGLEEGKEYKLGLLCTTFHQSGIRIKSLGDADFFNVLTIRRINKVMDGEAEFKELTPPKTSLVIGGEHYSIADEQLEQIQEILKESL